MTNAVNFTIRGPSGVGFSVGDPAGVGLNLPGFAVVRQALPAYDGPVEVTPSNVPQVLSTHDRSTYTDIVINPVPSNYGLITWDGSRLTVS